MIATPCSINKTMKGNVAVIGAGGFIGTNLVPYLLPRFDKVRCLSRSKAYPEAAPEAEWIMGDMQNAEVVANAIAGCHTVVHLACSSVPGAADGDIVSDAEAQIIASLKLMQACVNEGVRRIIFISSGGTVYGPGVALPTAETCPTNPITAYGVSKVAVEKYLQVMHRRDGLDYRILRVSNPYGPYQLPRRGQGVIASFLTRIMSGEPITIWGDGNAIRDYVYIDDLVRALDLSIRHTGVQRIFNIGSGQGTSINQLIAIIEEMLGITVERSYTASRNMDVAASILDCSLAARELGWRASTSLPAGIEHSYEWLKRHAKADVR